MCDEDLGPVQAPPSLLANRPGPGSGGIRTCLGLREAESAQGLPTGQDGNPLLLPIVSYFLGFLEKGSVNTFNSSSNSS